MIELVIMAILGAGAIVKEGCCIWVSGPGSLVAGASVFCGRFRHRKCL
jgi:hypothetical protein